MSSVTSESVFRISVQERLKPAAQLKKLASHEILKTENAEIIRASL